ncbi:MAG TPA: LUD domain-containing protein [Acidobacteriaceae bacterium]|jgi:L-lactate dehydrogenase complex protein LldG|nr:LUD domain-containing protein [Acidobacteriaceae bacterium]
MTDVHGAASSARSEILSRIRSITGSGPQAESPREAWQAIPRLYRQHGTLDSAQCIELLEDRLRDYGARVHHAGPSEIPRTIAMILAEREKQRILLSPAVSASWLPDGFPFVADAALSYQALDACDGVLTGCTVAIATTGTLVLCHGAGVDAEHDQGRRALTLIPDYHLCIVARSAVVQTVPEAMHLLEPYSGQPITFISGPSATADIEMTRIQGVHGPRILDVVIAE